MTISRSKCTSDGKVIGSAAMQGVEIGSTLIVETNHLGIHNRAAFDTRRFPHNAGIALRPVGSVHGVEPNAAIADMDLQPIAVVLQLVHPTRAGRRLD